MPEVSVQSEEQWILSIFYVRVKYYRFHLLNFVDLKKNETNML